MKSTLYNEMRQLQIVFVYYGRLLSGKHMKSQTFTASQLKILAAIAFICDYFTWGFIDFNSVPGFIIHGLGQIAAPITCYFIAEGFRKTTNLTKYLLRLSLCWLASVVPFYYFFHERCGFRQNVIFDLILGLILLIILNKESLSKTLKILLTVLIFVASMMLGGYPILSLAYILIFYFFRQKKDRIKWFIGSTVVFSITMLFLTFLNNTFHFLPISANWQMYIYIFGSFIALPFLLRYNGLKGYFPLCRYSYYLVYPTFLCILGALKYNSFTLNAYTSYVGVHIITMFIILVFAFMLLRCRPSKVHTTCMLWIVFFLIYLFAYLIEITADSLPGMISGIKVEFFAECFLFLCSTWFLSEFYNRPLSKFIYMAQCALSCVIMLGVYTCETNTYFYKSISINTTGPFPRIDLQYGVIHHLYMIYMVIISLYGLVIGITSLNRSFGIERRRIYCLITAFVGPWVIYFARSLGLTGGYEASSVGLLWTAIFVMIALFKYGYFDSVQIAGVNALQHGKEGILIIGSNHYALHFNQKMKTMFPKLRVNMNVYMIDELKNAFEGEIKTFTLHNKTYELRVEPLMESGYKQGYILWVIDMTTHYKELEDMRLTAHTDALTGLYNRNYFQAHFNEHLRLDGRGSMMMIDLDNFKKVNDTYGHDIGDATLIALSDTIKAVTEDKHLYCRIGGDEFCLFFMNVSTEEVLSDYAEQLIHTFKNILEQHELLGTTTMSIGIAVLDDDVLEEANETFDELYRRADRALYTSKNLGKNTYHFYSV